VTNATGQATIISFNRNYTGALAITNSLDGRPVTGISPIAFMNCTGLTSVSLPACITNILITFGSPFTSIKGLTAIDVDGANPNYRSVDGVFFNKEQAALLQFPASRAGSYRIPDTVTTILSGAFRNASLTSVTIPDSVAQIGNLAFSDCIGLTNVTIPAHLTNIASNAFYGCTGLTNAFFKAYSKAPRFRAASAASSASRQQTIEGLKQILGNTSDPAAKERLENLISMLERAEAGKSGTPSSTNSPTGRIYISPNASTNISVQTATAVRKPDGKWIVQFPNGNQMDMESYAARHGGVKNAIEHIKELMPGETNPDRLAYRKEQIKALEAMQAAGMK